MTFANLALAVVFAVLDAFLVWPAFYLAGHEIDALAAFAIALAIQNCTRSAVILNEINK